jgi:hypothetical protein
MAKGSGIAIRRRVASLSARPRNCFTISKSTSESSLGDPYAYDPKRMILLGDAAAAMASANLMMASALTIEESIPATPSQALHTPKFYWIRTTFTPRIAINIGISFLAIFSAPARGPLVLVLWLGHSSIASISNPAFRSDFT